MKKLIIVALGAVFLMSCSRTYVCEDSNGVSTGRVKAGSYDKAAAKCPSGSTVKKMK